MSDVLDRLDKLSPERQALLHEILRRRVAREQEDDAVCPREDRGPAPLSFAQQRLWLVDRLQPGSAAYNLPLALRLGGALDASALERALGEIVRRHESLRTTFAEVDGRPVQVIAPPDFALAVEDLSALPEEAREAAARRRATDEVARPFDLSRGPLFRAALLRLGDDDHVLLLTLHHIVTDGWSTGVLLRELAALYGAFRQGADSPLPPLAVQYADYAAWQRERLRGEALERELGWWRERLAGAPALLELPTDRPRPAAQSFRGARVPVQLSRELTERLRALGREADATPYMVLLAAFQVLLAKYGGSDDVVVGSPVAGRTRREVEELIGFFVNTLVLRTDLAGDPPFREALGRVRETTLGAFEHQQVPFEKLVEELQPERSLSHSPFFQVVFSLEDGGRAEGAAQGLPGLRMRGVEAEFETAKFDLSLNLVVENGAVRGALAYATDLFDRATVERLRDHLLRVLQQAAADPDARISRIRLVDDDERRMLVHDWNRTDRPYPRGVCLHALFERQAMERPDAPALEWGDATLTYAQLDARANRLARHLRRLGVGPEHRVGLLLERGPELITGILAILKAGGCYVPLDPAYPPERLRLMTADAGIRVLLTRGGTEAELADPELRIVRLDEAADALAAESSEPVRSGADPENLAYIVYTSGSTGRPKGVMVNHRTVVQLVVETDYVQFGPGDRIAQASNASFDALAFEMWGALLNGATLVGIDRETLLSPPAMRTFLREKRITTLYQTTALLNQLSREVPDIFQPLREVLFGGQAVDPDAVRRVLREGTPARLLHMYGPTETTAWCSTEMIEQVADDAATVSVGRPTGNQRIYILDAALQPLPVGIPGEAYVGGGGVVRGYLDRPGLTAERFVPDPFSPEPGARMYRTGDRLRWAERERAKVRKSESEDISALPDFRTHALEFVGRLDAQVKIRGFRIEPGEIEAALVSHPDVREARVVPRRDAPGETRLVAYIVGAADADGLRAHLRRSLPEYMLPAAFISLDRLPLTAVGKLDVRALPAPEYASAEERYVAPRTPVEETLAAIWADVLDAARVGTADDFFALGGHSLLAIRVVSRVREALGVELPLRALFEGPTVAEVAARVEALRRADHPIASPVVPVDRDRPLPLSFAQERMWFLDRLEPGNPFYNIPAALRLRGALDAAALERALGEIVSRHEALRTTFAEADGGPVQVIAPFAGFALPVDDLAALADAEREPAVRRIVAEEAARPFDLAAGPLLRAALLRLADDEHVLLLTLHHAVSDGWSLGVLFRELGVLYDAYRNGEPSPLAGLPVQYADYAVWQRARLAGEALERELAWWTERLAGAPALLELPTDRPRRPAQRHRGATVSAALPAELAERLRAAARREGATLFMVLLAAWQVLLAKYAGTDDVVVGSPTAGRTRAETEGLIGLFVNTLVLRTGLDGAAGFREVLRRAREATLGAFEHQEVPFERLVAELQPERSLSHAPLVQVLFTLAADEPAREVLPGLAAQGVGTQGETAKVDLNLAFAEGPHGLRAVLQYDADLFEADTARRMLGHLSRILEQVAADADLPLSRLALLDDAERSRVVDAWNQTDAAYPADQTLHGLIEAQAARTPDAVAVVFGDDALTYAELDARANRLARFLRRAGVGPEVRVGLCLERSLEMVISILAVLKAGGAYVPLDPGYPTERLRWMLADAGVSLVLTQDRLRGTLPETDARIVGVDAEWDAIAAESADAVDSGATPWTLAYVIYTSGSTGRPKGVMNQHGGVVNRLAWMQSEYRLGTDDVVLQKTPFSFDVSVWELLWPLQQGARLVMARPDGHRDPSYLQEIIERERVTTLHFVPSMLQPFVEAADADRCISLKRVICSGEALAPALVDAFHARFPSTVSLHNLYGPTEAAIDVSHWTCERSDSAASVPIGRPVWNTRLYVLDAHLQPTPDGVPGELYIGGVQVARGYLRRPSLTAERFIPDPFSATPGARLYRTGDRARWRALAAEPDATLALSHSRTFALEYLGRLDQQVKIRGFRIEPGEIEAALRRAAGVSDCAVVARADESETRLVAYVVGEADTEVLRTHLRQSLPEHMVPAAFVAVDALPLTPSGKLDRRALPAPEFAGDEARHVAPRTPLEEVLAGIWAEVLRAERVGAGDDFFSIGGHSLLATRVVSRIRALFGVELPLRAMFEAPTVAQLAERVEAVRRAGLPHLPPIAPVDRARRLPLSFAQERLWFLDRLEPENPFYNLPAALRLAGELDVAALERALGEIVRRHEALRTVFADADGVAYQVVRPFAGFALPMEDAAGLDEAAVRRRVSDEAARPFDLERGPLFRATLLRRSDDVHLLLLGMHHVVSDGWSIGILFRELAALYESYENGEPSPLPELPVQYADFAAWQREQLAGEALARELAWWTARLAGAPALLELPTDHPRPAAQAYRGARVAFALPAGVAERLAALGRREGATLYMVLLGAFQALLARYAGTDDVVVGSPTAGRTRREVEELIGLFADTLVLRTDLSGDPAFREVLRRVRETTLGAFEHQQVPFEKLVAELQPERSLSHSPVFQVLFVLQNAAGDGADAADAGLRMEPVRAELDTTQFDLSLHVSGDGRAGALTYRTDLFERPTIERMAGHLARLLEQVSADPDLPPSRVDLLGEAERARVVDAWNQTDAAYPADQTLHGLIEAQAARTPDSVAVVFADDVLTYGELDARANRLARFLRRAGVGPEVRVGLCLERSLEMVISILAVLKAGGAYVPLDPGYPAERLRWMLADAGVSLVLTQDRLRDTLPETDARIVGVDADRVAIAAQSADAVDSGATPATLAYVIYTSGSTGRPKGVMNQHGGVVNRLAWMQAEYGLTPDDVVLQKTPFSFDVSVWEFLWPLQQGATLVMARPDGHRDPAYLQEIIQRERVTTLHFVPSMLQPFVEAADADRCISLKRVICSGEALAPALVDAFHARFPSTVSLHNLYGPTEAAIDVSHWTCERSESAASVPIGRPVWNTRLYVLDAHLQPTPVGVPGELYIGGVQVARGYLGRPALTAERFVPDPFSAEPGARLYRTGDRARWRALAAQPDATFALSHSRTFALEYLGRLDQQVKIRGFRIEPAEIEAVLRRADGVSDCAVVAREDAPGHPRLVAYVAGGADAEALRGHLRKSLPEHMVPAAFVVLDALPLTPSGKLDRRALPAPDFAGDEARFVAPRTPVEQVLAAIWAEVLRIDRVGVNEGFFTLGGDSILAIQVVSRARRAGVGITPRQMFEHQTVAALAAVATSAAEAPRAEQGRVTGAARLTPVQARFFEQALPVPAHYNQGMLLEVDAAVPDAVLAAALAAVLDHHDALRLRFRRMDAGWEQWHADETGIALEHADLSALAPAARDQKQDEIADTRQASLHLEHGPLGRAVLFHRGEEGRMLFLVLHHLVVDGVSWRILRDDLERACAQLQAGERIDLGARSTSYRQWADALAEYAAGDAVRAELAHWLAQGPAGVAALPAGGAGEAASATVAVRLDAEETRALLQDAPAAYRTQINDLLLCALAEAVTAWAGGSRVRLALEGHGREEEIGAGVDLTRTVGWFTSVYPVVLDLAGAAGPGERIKRVKEQLRAVPRRGIGHGVLRWMSPDAAVRAALAAQPEPEISFNYLGRFDGGAGEDARLRFAGGPRGRDRADANRTPYRLDVNGAIRGSLLELAWTFDPSVLTRETVERLAERYARALRGLAAHCRAADAGGATPSDFPLAGLAQPELDALLGNARGIEDLYPLAPLQEGILFHALAGDGSQAYQVQAALRLEGPLDGDVLRRAWQEAVARHPVLRTAFAWEGVPRPLQVVHAAAALEWTAEDWRGLQDAEQEAALDAFLAADRARGLDLHRPPLLRCALLRVADDAHWLVWNQHHLLMDGWSSTRVLNEVMRLYGAWAAGRAVELGRPRPYREYVGWLARQDPGAAERYWRGVLAGFTAATSFGVDRAAAGEGGMRHGKRQISLSPELTRRLDEAARRGRVTLATVLQGAWGLLLARYTGADDVVFGSTVSGRPAELEGVEEMVGLFINTLPVRVRVPGDARLGPWLAAIQRGQAEAREYEYSPLAQVQGWSEVPRGTPLFESHFIFENFPVERGGEGGAGSRAPLRMTGGRVLEWNSYPLSLMAVPGRALRLGLSYDENRFDAAGMERMLRHVERLLEQVAADADARLADLTLLGADERRMLLEEWNRTAGAYPSQLTIHQLFAAQAARVPEAAAVVFGAESLTYSEVDARANRIANHLRRMGVGPEVRVGVCLERGPELIPAILGVMKAGGAYVPVDPAHPAERIGYVLEDSAVPVLLTQARLIDRVPVRGGVRVVAVDAEWPRIAEESADAPETGVASENLCYVIYTSGSTGRPKGVAMHHRGVVNYVHWGIGHYGADTGNGAPVFSSMAVDLTITNLLPLFAGKPVHLLPEENPVEALAALLREKPDFGLIKITPTHLALLTPLLTAEDARAAARTLVIGADFLPAEPTVWWQENAPDVRLMNEYGPTETVVGCSAYTLPNGVHRHGPVPVGGAIRNLTFFVLDAHLQPVPAGLPGELYIGGAGVARGYLGRPALSAEKFVPDPFSAGPGARMYRTGDRARWLDGGNLMILGRADHQVKVRGYRVELGEIEATLRRHEAVEGAVVVVREDAPGDRRLVGYVVSGAEPAELRAFLRRTLPEYMVPAAFVRLETLPKTSTGKFDPRALPAPEYAGEAGYVEPRTPVQAALAEVWGEILGAERVGATDGFFELGGHSLLAVRVVSRVREVFGVELPLRAVFDGPALREMADAIEALRRAESAVLPPVVPVDRDRPLPLSFAQERLWFLDRLQPGGAAYNVATALRLHGPLDTGALERAFAGIVRRHEVLRTTFAEMDGAPVQVIPPFAGFALSVDDLAALGDAEREAAMRARAAEEGARPFDLERGPLLRARLLRMGAEEHVLLLTLHHAVSDGWSLGVLFRELAALYGAYGSGGSSPLAELPVQYADFAAWQREQLAGQVLGRELAYWRERLAGAPALLALPTDRPRPAVQTTRGAHVRAAIPADRVERLRALGRREGATLYMVLLGAFQLLLAKYGGSDDVVVGSPVAGRTRAETEGLIGFFVNTLVLRTELAGARGFREVLRRVRETTLQAYEHQEVPFEKLVEALQPERSLSHAPLVQVMFTLDNAGTGWPPLPGVRTEGVAVERDAAKYDLSLTLAEDARGLHAFLHYNADLFDRATGARMLEHLSRLLEQVAADPDLRLSAVVLPDEAERARVVEEWNRTDRPYPRRICLHERFEAQVRANPAASALEWGDATLTYAQLDARANRLARHLRRLGVGPEARVGVLLERGPELVVAILAALKAGGCYVPLDPAYPPGRLELMLADAGVRVLVTRGAHAEALALDGVHAVRLDEAADALAAESAAPVRSGGTAENLAYIVYTSGSTGRPKGVMVNHRTVVQLVVETDYVRFGPGDRIAQASNPSFDALAFEMWGALLNGATLVGIDRDVLLSPPAMRAFLREKRITTLYQTTALLNQLSREVPDIFQPLREVLFGGQAVDPDAVRRVLREGKPARLLHMYGPTETTAWCSTEMIEQVADDAATVSVGRPTGNQRIYILDAALQPLPIGVAGEAYVGGGGVVRGYLDRPGLTAERFVPDPFSSEPGARMYRTGDRLRWAERERAKVRRSEREDISALPDFRTHALEFVGRLDAQVKIRGFRIEPGEVESTLSAHPGVREARVVVREDAPGEKRLVAYVVGDADHAALRAHLRRNLPEYMLPGAVVTLDRLPLTAVGKLDVRALPAPELASSGDAYVAPRTPLEEVLAALWAEVLGVERAGAVDGFFALGGHSLLAIRLVSRIRDALGVELPLRALFEGPTVAETADAVEALRRADHPIASPVVPVDRDRPLPLSFAQERLWFLDRLQPGSAVYNVSTAMRLRGALDARALERALGETVRRHESLRTTFAEVDGAPVQVIAPFTGFTLAVEDLALVKDADREAEARRRASIEAAEPFDLAAGPLFRARLLRLADDDHVLLMSMHHVVSDGWSLGVLFRELSVLYRAYREGEPSPLADLPVQYADFAAWQRARLHDAALEAELGWWRARLAGAPALLELPTDHPRPAEQGFRGAHQAFGVPAALLERLRGVARAEGATLFMVLLGAWQVLLGRYAATDDVVVGTAVAGRERRETEGLIGFFVNTLALRTDLAGDPSFRQALRRVRETTLGAFEHQEVPWERLVGELQPERSLSHAPVVQVAFALDQGESGAPAFHGLRAEGVGADAGTTKLDLTLSLGTRPDGGLRGALSYATALFRPATVRRMAEHLVRVLEQAAADPDVRISRIRLLGDAERTRVLAWGGTAPAHAPGACAHVLVAARAARTPDAEALRFAGRATTYRALDQAANRLAHHLAARGVGPESRVGVLAERAPETVVAILAVLKAGGAFVPLDPAYPAERLRYMLRDSGARTVIAPAGAPAGLPADLVADLLDLRAEAARIAARPSHPPAVAVDADGVAYVIYTSGSTGRPKGVMVAHRGIPNLAYAQAGPFAVDPSSRVLQFASFSFDAAVAELFGALLAGATLVLAPREELLPGDGLVGVLRRERISVVTLPPSVLAVLPPDGLPALRTIVSAGEPVDAATVARWGDGRRFVNAYGPTEITVCATAGVCAADGGTPSIGGPIDGVRVHVLDAAGEPAPIGIPGELFVGGAGVARGYLGRPGRTAERFVPDPFGAPGGRLYRTGDRVRWTAEGTLEFAGRVDGQVKVRGFRIEPGEVEAALRREAGVADCAVAVRADAAGERRLVAYVVGTASAGELRTALRASMPDYMVPAAFVPLERLPLTPNGKVDRGALPAPTFAGGAVSPPPRDGMEERVAAVWRDVLGAARIGVHDNFFDLGGTSLLLVRVHARLREIRPDLRVVDLFRHGTVEELARWLQADAAPDGDGLARSRSRGEARRAARSRGRGGDGEAGR